METKLTTPISSWERKRRETRHLLAGASLVRSKRIRGSGMSAQENGLYSYTTLLYHFDFGGEGLCVLFRASSRFCCNRGDPEGSFDRFWTKARPYNRPAGTLHYLCAGGSP